MSHAKRTWIEVSLLIALSLVLILMVIMDARAQEKAEAAKYSSNFEVEYEISQEQVKKLEAKAISIIRRKGKVTGEQATRAEALSIVRPNGVTDVQICFEILSIDRLYGIKQASLKGVRIQRLPK